MIQANSLNIPLKDESVQCVICSPPYWGLRDYGTATWEGGKDGCDHILDEEWLWTQTYANSAFNSQAQKRSLEARIMKNGCPKCGAKRIDNQLGLEKTPEEYVENTVKWAREVWRVLRMDGCFFLNLGDSYAGGGRGGLEGCGKGSFEESRYQKGQKIGLPTGKIDGLKPKDLCEIPSDVVRALRADGWYLRSRMPWVKRSAMPESCTDRPASALEYMFLLTKSSKYYFDMDAIRLNFTDARMGNPGIYNRGITSDAYPNTDKLTGNMRPGKSTAPKPENAGRNFRNTDLFYQSLEEPHGAIFCGEEMVGLDVNPQAYSEAHFATFPEWLVTPLIKAGTSEKGACPECGSAWVRMVEKKRLRRNELDRSDPRYRPNQYHGAYEDINGKGDARYSESKTIGWQPTCKCGIAHPDSTYLPKPLSFVPYEPVLCIVLDPFAGSFTTKSVAEKLGRRGIGLELKWEYIQMGKKRCKSDQKDMFIPS